MHVLLNSPSCYGESTNNSPLGSVKDLFSLRIDEILERHVFSHLVGHRVRSRPGVLLLWAVVTGVGLL